jgi:hypothetical protein
MGKQYNKVLKRSRRKSYLKRKKEAAAAKGKPKAKAKAATKKSASKPSS